MNNNCKIVFTIQITYLDNTDKDDYEDMLNELIAYASDHSGLNVNGSWVIARNSDDDNDL